MSRKAIKLGEVKIMEPAQVSAILFLVIVAVVGVYFLYRGRKKKAAPA